MPRTPGVAPEAQPVPQDERRLASYDFALPPEAIAQRPAPVRDAARLMVVDPSTGIAAHSRFDQLGRFLRPGDVVVLNDSMVVPARLRGCKESGGAFEALLVERENVDHWVALVRTGRRPPPGALIRFGHGLSARWVADCGNGRARLRFSAPRSPGTRIQGTDASRDAHLDGALTAHGEVPLPPYINRPAGPDAVDRERYQTVYARVPGSIAAPTAGLHFTPELLDRLERQGTTVARLTLHVGPGTFQPIRSEDVSQLELEGERYHIPEATSSAIATARATGGRVIAVGTTTTRALEAAVGTDGIPRAGAGIAQTVIRPGYRFRVIEGLVTNFHLPRSSLLLLVSAFLGRERTHRYYAEALARGYRFYSYGDAMLALPHPLAGRGGGS